MDITGVASSAVQQASRQRTGDDLGIAVLNKALDVEVSSAATLINSVAQPPEQIPTEKLPPHLGRNINVTA